jgi:hypothetical protein
MAWRRSRCVIWPIASDLRQPSLYTEQPEVAESDSECVVAEGNSREIVANLTERVDAGWTGRHRRTEQTLLSTTRPYGSGSNGRQPIGLNPSDRKVVRVRIPPRALGLTCPYVSR